MTTRTITAAVLLTLLAFTAALFLAAGLGTADAAAEQTGGSAALRIYATGEAGAPALTDDVIARWDGRLDVLCALPVRETAATLQGPGWSIPVTLTAVTEDGLPLTSFILSSGDFPDSAWENQGLLSAGAALALSEAVGRTGGTFPSRAKLWIGGREVCDAAGVAPLDIALSGTVSDQDALPGAVLLTDTALLMGFMEENKAYCLDLGIAAAPVRADLYLRSSADRAGLAQSLRDLGYLVTDPLAERDAVLTSGKRMSVRWGALAAVLAAACLASALFLRSGDSMMKTVLTAAAAATAGVLLALAVTQTAMLLGWDFFTDSQARYLMTLPRALAVYALCLAVGLPGHIREPRQRTVPPG